MPGIKVYAVSIYAVSIRFSILSEARLKKRKGGRYQGTKREPPTSALSRVA